MKYILIIFAALFLFSCKNKQVEIINPDGSKEVYSITKDSLKHGAYIAYDANGQISEKANYANGELEGEREVWIENVIRAKEHYKNGVMDGFYTEYYENGQPAFEANYVSGKIQGQSKTYHKNGKLKCEAIFVDGEENGPFKEYHDNGKIAWEGTFRNGDNEFGELKAYNKEGVHVKTLTCDERAICTTIWTLEQ